MQTSTTEPHGSELAQHPEACARCGTFADLKPFWGRRLCADCSERESRVLRGDGVGVGGLITGLASLPLRVWCISVALHCAADLPSLIRTLAGSETRVGFELVLDPLASVLVTYIGVEALLGRSTSTNRAWKAFWPRFLPWLQTTFLAGLLVVALSLLFVVPGIVRALSLALTTPIVLFEPLDTANGVLAKSTERMRGTRLAAAAVYGLSMAMPLLVSMLLPSFMVERVVFGAHVVGGALELCAVVLGAPISLITALLYVRLTPPQALPAPVAVSR